MPKTIFLNIDDDVSRAVARLKKESDPEVVLALPKNAWLLSSAVNLKLLKKQSDLLGKRVAIMTRDEKGREFAAAQGFGLAEPDYLNRTAVNIDVNKKLKRRPGTAAPGESSLPVIEHRPDPDPLPPIQSTANLMPWEQTPEQGLQEKPQEISVQPIAIADPEPQFQKIELQPETRASLQKPNRREKWIWRSVIAAVVLFALIVVFVLPSAQITVYALTQPISRDFQLKVDKTLSAPNQDQLALPGKLLGDNQNFTMQFDATGKVDVGVHARGTVQIYNFTAKILKLNAATTTLTVGAKSFHFQSDQSELKPTRYFPGSKTPDPASLGTDVEVIADQPGSDSDFPAGTRLEIHNQVLGTAPQLLYAKVKTPIDFGSSEFRATVSQQDLDGAQKAFTAKIISDENQKYAAQGLEILSSGSNLQLQSFKFDQQVGAQVDKFSVSSQVIFSALAFDPNAAHSMVEQRINLTLDPAKYLVTGSTENFNEQFQNDDLNAGTGTLDVHFEGEVAAKLDTGAIAAKIGGKNTQQLREMLLADPNINAVDIKFAPFWVHSVPRFSGMVKVLARLSPTP